MKVNTSVYASQDAWRAYAIGQLQAVERLAGEIGPSVTDCTFGPTRR